VVRPAAGQDRRVPHALAGHHRRDRYGPRAARRSRVTAPAAHRTP